MHTFRIKTDFIYNDWASKVVIADSDGKMKFGDFIANLLQAGATEAIYLDMGGWNYSWYRDDSGKVIDIHPTPNKYATNWITFYK